MMKVIITMFFIIEDDKQLQVQKNFCFLPSCFCIFAFKKKVSSTGKFLKSFCYLWRSNKISFCFY
jgi:hypothetical protein